MKAIKVGDEFSWPSKLTGTTTFFRREPDDLDARPSEQIRVRVLRREPVLVPAELNDPYTFGTEPEWFVQRGMVAG
jgi:hypothetical protein